MRLERHHEQRGRPTTNGSSQNGSSPHTNGTTNGYHNGNEEEEEEEEQRSHTYYGHNREEVTRLLLQSLSDLGYRQAAQHLSRESGYQLEVPSVASFRTAVLAGEWDQAEALLFGDSDDEGGVSLENGQTSWPLHSSNRYYKHGLPLAEGVDIVSLRFLIRQQKYLELLESRDISNALQVLRNELTPLKREIPRLHWLSALMMCSSARNLRERASWDGAHGESRNNLLCDISKSISPSVMIPEHRLSTLLDAVQAEQTLKCRYHNTTTPPSLYTSHECSIEDFPTKTLIELKDHADEIWSLCFSHDGSMLAAAGKEGLITIHETTRWKLYREWREHERSAPTPNMKGVCQIAFSPDDKYLASCSFGHEFLITSVEDNRVIARGANFEYPVSAIAWMPDSERFVVGSQSTTRPLGLYSIKATGLNSTGSIENNEIHSFRDLVWDPRIRESKSTTYRVAALGISHTGELMAASTTDARIIIFDMSTKQPIHEWQMDGQVTSITFSNDCQSILVNMHDDQVLDMDIAKGDIVKSYVGIRQRNLVLKSCYGGAGQLLVVSGSEDSSICLWRRESAQLIATLKAHKPCAVNAVAWHPTNPGVFASAGDDRRVRIWTSANALKSRSIENGM